MGSDRMDDLEKFDTTVSKKFEIMRTKNEFLLQNFPDFPITETVIQNYRCTFKQGEQSFGGKVWLTQNYLLFTSSTLAKRSQIPYMEIKRIKVQEGFLSYTSEMFLDLDSGFKVSFTNFYHFREAYILVKYLMDHSPCYYHLPSHVPPPSSSGKPNPQNSDNRKVDGRWGELATSMKSTVSASEYVKPDVKLAEDCLDLAEEIFYNGVEIRGAVQEDAKTLDRIER